MDVVCLGVGVCFLQMGVAGGLGSGEVIGFCVVVDEGMGDFCDSLGWYVNVGEVLCRPWTVMSDLWTSLAGQMTLSVGPLTPLPRPCPG